MKKAEILGVVDFERQKTRLFENNFLHARKVLKTHMRAGLWGKRHSVEDWRNVTKHCAVEAARVSVLSDMLGLAGWIHEDLRNAAWLHDARKKREIEIINSTGNTLLGVEMAERDETEKFEAEGLSGGVLYLLTAVKFAATKYIETILQKPQLSEREIAFLIMYYVDSYTRGSDWVESAQLSLSGKTFINDVDRRMTKNASNLNYLQINEEGRRIFDDRTIPEAMQKTAHNVEKKLYLLIQEKFEGKEAFLDIPERLPECIDQKLREKITASSLDSNVL